MSVFVLAIIAAIALCGIFHPFHTFAATINPPFPPLEYRKLVGPLEDRDYDNSSGAMIFPEIDQSFYDSVLDFGCGCGRHARQLLQQNAPPNHYLGIDIHPRMIAWCQAYLTPLNYNFKFFHHLLLTSFPANSGEFSLVNAHSVFTHLYKEQSIYYLKEIERVLRPDGIARTTWFFFDRDSFPCLANFQVCLYVNELDCTNAVIYDRSWFLDTIRQCGFAVVKTIPPSIPGGQWIVLLRKRKHDSTDYFPMDDEAAESLCGAHISKK